METTRAAAETDVLIAGAGPTGLVLALWLARCGVRVRVVDKAAEPGTTSRALAVHARTLELYRPLGLADAVVARGLEFAGANFWVRGRRVARAELGPIGTGISAYPYVVVFPQDEHERLLIERLRDAGVEVERPVAVAGFDERADRVVARLVHSDGRETSCEAAYIVGCDGARSTVRELVGEGFPGGTYSHLFYVADAEATGPVMNRELHVALDDADFLAVFPLRREGHARFIGTVTAQAAARHGTLAWQDVSPAVIEHVGVKVNHVNWFSTYHVHHRVVNRFRAGRAFLAGDAAHIHSPVGGQGMNTGIGDAINLAWKLAAVVQGRADASLLASYEPERIAFARRLVATTDRAFQLVTSTTRRAAFVRVRVMPRVLPVLARLEVFRRLIFRTISQTAIEYRDSPLSRGDAGRVRAGDRLPWLPDGDVANGDAGNYAPLASLDWQVHVYGEASRALADAMQARGVALHAFPWRDAASAKGFERDAAYLLRPDGYVGCAAPATQAAATLDAYLRDWSIVPRRDPPRAQ